MLRRRGLVLSLACYLAITQDITAQDLPALVTPVKDQSNRHDEMTTDNFAIDNFVVENLSLENIDRACLQNVLQKLLELVDSSDLNPVRTEIFSESPIVVDFLKRAYVKTIHNGVTIMAGFAQNDYVITIDKLNRYALYKINPESKISFYKCLTES